MDVVINDFSLDGQFKDAEDFFDMLVEETLPAFRSLADHNCELLSSFETYNRKVSANLTLFDVLTKGPYRGYPEATKLKSFLASCTSDPFWANAPQTDIRLKYTINGEVVETVPNCFTEAFARDNILFSFQSKRFKCDKLKIIVDGQEQSLYNLFDKETAGQALFCKNAIGLAEFLMGAKCGKSVFFFGNNGNYYSDEGFENGNLTIEDGLSIFKDFKLSIDFLCRGELKSRFSDSITYKKVTYYEFRCTLSNQREFRIYYFLDSGKLVYLNSIVKKTAQIPEGVKKRTIDLIQKYWDKVRKQN